MHKYKRVVGMLPGTRVCVGGGGQKCICVGIRSACICGVRSAHEVYASV